MAMHHSIPRGQRALIILRTGERVVEKFHSRTKRDLLLGDHGGVRLRWQDVRAFAPWRAGVGVERA